MFYSYQSYRIATWLIVLVLTLSLVDSNYESDIYDLEDEMTVSIVQYVHQLTIL